MEGDFFETTIGDQVTLQRGFDITKKHQVPGDVPVVSSGGISSFHNEAKVEGPGVVLGRKGTLGTVFYLDRDYWPHDTSLWVKDFKNNNPRFVYYFFLNLTVPIKKMDVGAANPTLNRNHVHILSTKWPKKDMQDNICHTLSALDNKIQLNRQTNEILEKMAQALFKSWFVDFDPVIDNALEAGNTIPDELQDRAARRQQQLAKPDHQPLPDDIRQLFPSVFEMTKELGWVPMGWEVSTINDHTHFKNGYAFKSKQLLSSDEKALPVFKMGHINRGGGFKPGGTKSYFPKAEIDEKLSNYLAEKGDLLMSMTDMKSNMVILGNTALMPFSNVFLINQRVARLRIKNDTHLDYPYLYFYTNHPPVVDELRSRANSGVQVNLTSASIKETLLLVPEAPVHSVFDQKIKALLEKSFANDNNSKELGELRDTLLPKLISGELRLPLDALSDAKQKLADATSWQ